MSIVGPQKPILAYEDVSSWLPVSEMLNPKESMYHLSDAIEPEIGRMKPCLRLGGNFLKGIAGEAVNAIRAGAAKGGALPCANKRLFN